MSDRTRTEALAGVTAAARRHHAVYTLFNQAMAEQLGLHPTDLQCVSLLRLETRARTTGEVAKLTGLTSGSATRLVDRLERAGLVERTSDSRDRRRTLVSLTIHRSPDIDAAWETPARAFDRALDDFTDEELTVIERYLERITEVGSEQTTLMSGG
ncbi:MarR family winged helix-turn-helix transcriptional regulator [Streptomyces sp. NPDC056500]|uniref:MarR family winged helix-turn-helix transcriptional regulator n=1 Tax=Streptomyces sp. NPDC056500 TaxID=3345840 RepID=UPI0036AEBD4D